MQIKQFNMTLAPNRRNLHQHGSFHYKRFYQDKKEISNAAW